MTSASRFLPASRVIDYIRHGYATPSRESLLGDIISARRDTFARRVDFASPSRLQLTNETQAQDEIERSEFKLPDMGSLCIIIGVNVLSQVISIYATLSQRPRTELFFFPLSFLSSSSFHLQVSTQNTLEAQPLFPVS
jgi:hypothetical protein